MIGFAIRPPHGCHLSNPAAARRRSDARPATLSLRSRFAGLPTVTVPAAAGTAKPCPFPDTTAHRTCRGGACMHVEHLGSYIVVSMCHLKIASATYRQNYSTVLWVEEQMPSPQCCLHITTLPDCTSLVSFILRQIKSRAGPSTTGRETSDNVCRLKIQRWRSYAALAAPHRACSCMHLSHDGSPQQTVYRSWRACAMPSAPDLAPAGSVPPVCRLPLLNLPRLGRPVAFFMAN